MSSPVERVVFLPGAGADGRFWQPVAERLPEEWVKVLVDYPGLGNVPPRPEVNGLADLLDLVLEQLFEPAHVVAQSMGGVLAAAAALRRPQAVRRLVLAATPAGIDTSDVPMWDWRPDYRRRFPDAASWMMECKINLTERLPQLDMPTLLLWGNEDRICPLAIGKRLERLLPEASLTVISTDDHGFAATQADEVAPLIRRHLVAGSL